MMKRKTKKKTWQEIISVLNEVSTLLRGELNNTYEEFEKHKKRGRHHKILDYYFLNGEELIALQKGEVYNALANVLEFVEMEKINVRVNEALKNERI